LDVKRQINDNRTPHEKAQHHATCAPTPRPSLPSRSCRSGFDAGRPIPSIRAPGEIPRISRLEPRPLQRVGRRNLAGKWPRDYRRIRP
jgi:hypothetical protein